MKETIKKTKISGKELIKKLKDKNASLILEKEELGSYLDNLEEEKENLGTELFKLKTKVEEGERYRKAFSVILTCIEEKRLAWSLSKEYDRQKKIYDNQRESNKVLKDILKPMSKIRPDKKGNVNLDIDLTKMLGDLF